MTWSSVISAVVIPSRNTYSGESMWAPVCRLWFTLDTCQKPGPRRCGVTSRRMLVEGGLRVCSSTVTERSMNRLMEALSREVRDGTGGAGRLDDVQPGVGAVDQIDVAPVVHFRVVGLDGAPAPRRPRHLDAALVGSGRGVGDEETGLDRVERVADVHRAHPRVEVGDEHEPPVVDRRERFVARVRPEPAAAPAEVAGGIGHLEGGHRVGCPLGGAAAPERGLTDFRAFFAQ